jgi:trehalose utilization protein
MRTRVLVSGRNGRDRELVWTVDPTHPVAAGVPNPIVIDA